MHTHRSTNRTLKASPHFTGMRFSTHGQTKRLAACVALIVALGASPVAHGQAAQMCEGTARHTLTAVDGTVLVMPSFRNDWIQVCNVSVAWKGVPTAICNMWVSFLATATAAQRPVMIAYPNAPACSQMPAYDAAPAPSYISLQTTFF